MLRKAAVFAALLALPLAAVAQPRPLSLEEALAAGLEKSPGLHASRLELEAATARSREVAAGRLPSLKLGGGYTRLSEVPDFQVTLPISPDPIVVSQSYFNQFNLRLGVQQPLFTGFRLQAGERSARLLEAAAGQDLEKNRAELVFAVKAAYWGLTRSREFEKVIDENVRQVGEHLKDVRAFFDQGLATRNDVLRAELELSNAEIMRIDARNAAEVALTTLVSLIGLPLDADIDLTTSVESRASRIPAEAGKGDGDPIERALAQRPEIKSAEFRIKASEMGVKAVRSAFLPQVYLSGNYYYLRPNPRILPSLDRFKGTWDVGVSVSFDIWNWGQTKRQTEQAEARLGQAREARKVLEDQAVLEVTQCRLSLARAGEKVRVAGQAVGQAEENLRVTTERFKQGVALSSDVLDAEVALLRAKLGRTQAAIDQVVAQARLEKALGE
ncbi:MAG: outer rane efflux protein [Candidatus Aminicenantes bacterium]|nr:outer rane efflux protein [Candidatus Aminicenantes bacterium]